MADFTMPELRVDADKWGPPSGSVPSQFANLPFYRDFSKSAHFGRAADWTAAGEEQAEYRNLMRQKRIERDFGEEAAERDQARAAERKRTGTGGIFGYKEGDDVGFQLVDTSSAHGGTKVKTSSVEFGRGRGRGVRGARGAPRGARGRGGRGGAWGASAVEREGAFARKAATGQRNDGQSRYGRRWRQRWTGQRWGALNGWGRQEDDVGIVRPWSLEPQEGWNLQHEFWIQDLETAKEIPAPSVEDLQSFGTLHSYNRDYDRCSTRNPKPLTGDAEIAAFYNVTTSEDPIISQIAASSSNDQGFQVFATDSIIAHLMSTPRSSASWDVVVRRVGNKLFFDKREDSEELNLLSVNENGVDPPLGPESTALNTEATFINQQFTQQVLQKDEEPALVLGGPSPFALHDEAPASVGYKYRRWTLDVDGGVSLVVRSEIEGCLKRGDDLVPISIKALNESFWEGSKLDGDAPKWKRQRDSTIDWRRTMDTQPSAVMAHELKLNANKVTKWMCEMVLADTKLIKLGYVSRTSPENHFNHVVLATQELQPSEFAAQIQFKAQRAWTILASYIAVCKEQPEGLYLLLRAPDENVVRLFTIPSVDDLDQSDLIGEDEEDYDF